MSFLSYVSRINIEIGRSFIHRSFPRRVEYPYLSEWGRQARDETRKTLRRLGSRFLSPFLPSSFPSCPSNFSLCLCSSLRISVSLSSWRFSRDLRSSLSFASFCSLLHQPPVCLSLAAAISFLRFSLLVGAPTAFDSFWAELAWPLARAQTRARFNPLGRKLHPDRWAELEL